MTKNFDIDDFSQEDFEKLMEESLTVTDDFQPGDQVKGVIVAIGKEDSFLDVSGKSEAVISTAELFNKDGKLEYEKGDQIEVYVVSVKGGEIKVTFKIGKGEANPELLEMAYHNEMPVEGIVTDEVKGGYSVTVSGIRCFCPFSQIDIKANEDKTAYINQTYSFKIIEFKEKGRNIIVSRRALLETIQAKAEMELKETLNIGDTVSGEISSIRDFGFFVNLSGIEALVPKSEISWSRNLTDIKQKPGDTVTAKIIDINWNAKKITLSLRQMTPEPWTVHKLKENQAINGKVSAIIPQGAFIELEPGIDGFLHISRMSVTRKINKPEEILAIADSVNVKIREINEKEKKISLELITDEADPWLTADDNITKEVHKGIVENIKNSGISIRLNNGMLGFIPKGELLTSSDMQKNYRTGSEITASVKDFDKNLRKLILSEKGAIKKEEEKDYNAFLSKSSEASGTSLGGLFKDKFLEIQKQVKKQ